MLCLEGISIALRTFLKISQPPCYVIKNKDNNNIEKFYIDESVKEIRHFACSAILRDITFTEENLKGFMELQDKLHQNICRNRTLVTMGTHDLDTVKGPFTFKALPPKEFKFTILNRNQEMTGEEIINELNNDHKLKHYTYLLKDCEKYPVLMDSNNVIMALPPLINSNHSRITTNTKNVIIDVTAHDETKAIIVLNMLVTMFSIYCQNQFTVEAVEVINQHSGVTKLYPLLETKEIEADIHYMNKIAGTNNLSMNQISELLQKMSLQRCI